jgi:chromosome partitioning protein
MIIALLNQKAGVGKTTLALHLAGVWACQGRRIIVIDADPQACALEWSELRASEGLPKRFGIIGFARDTLHREAPKFTRDVDHVIIDGPPYIAALTRSALLAADLIVVPTQPPPFEGSALAETLRLANATSIFRPQLRTRLVLNRCDMRAVTNHEAAQALTDYDPPALTNWIGERAVVADAMQNGRLVFEMADSTAAVREITALAAEIERIAQ